jgi:hypothetical protein
LTTSCWRRSAAQLGPTGCRPDWGCFVRSTRSGSLPECILFPPGLSDFRASEPHVHGRSFCSRQGAIVYKSLDLAASFNHGYGKPIFAMWLKASNNTFVKGASQFGVRCQGHRTFFCWAHCVVHGSPDRTYMPTFSLHRHPHRAIFRSCPHGFPIHGSVYRACMLHFHSSTHPPLHRFYG